jgi:hypothetical protein
MSKLQVFAKKVVRDTADYKVEVGRVLDVRVEGLTTCTNLQVAHGREVEVEWWAVERDGHLHVCTEFNEHSKVIKNIDEFDSFMAATLVRVALAEVLRDRWYWTDAKRVTQQKKKRTKHLLLVWDENPEKISLFVIPLSNTELCDLARRSNDCYINGGEYPDDHAIFALTERLATDEAKAYRKKAPIKRFIVEVVKCGFIM